MREAMVGDGIRAGGANWAGDDRNRSRNAGVAGLHRRRVAQTVCRELGEVAQFVHAQLVIVSAEEYDMVDVVVGDELQEGISLGPIAANPRFAPVVTAANRADLVDRRRDGHDLPGLAVLLSREQRNLQPG